MRRRPKNRQFGAHEPYEDAPSIRLVGANGSFGFLHPTSAVFTVDDTTFILNAASASPSTPVTSLDLYQSNGEISLLWRSRDNRKGRHALLLRPQPGKPPRAPTNTVAAVLHGIRLMLTRFPYQDISWWIAVIFTLGSAVWVANGFLGLLPLLDERFSEQSAAAAWLALAGGSVFLVCGAVVMLEAVNANRLGCSGWAFGSDGLVYGHCRHKYHYRENEDVQGEAHKDGGTLTGPYTWKWWPSWRELRHYYFFEIGFIICLVQFISTIFFWLGKFVTLPGVAERAPVAAIDGAHWAPQTAGCLGFVVASVLSMMETQPYWYAPAPAVLGWHIGLFKLVGSIGFTISSAFGFVSGQWAAYQSALASFWGSWAFLIGGLMQWYESLDKHPVVQEGHHFYSEWRESYMDGSHGVDGGSLECNGDEGKEEGSGSPSSNDQAC